MYGIVFTGALLRKAHTPTQAKWQETHETHPNGNSRNLPNKFNLQRNLSGVAYGISAHTHTRVAKRLLINIHWRGLPQKNAMK